MSTKKFWLSYDCDGEDCSNYDDIYHWLREHQSIECGNSVAFVQNYNYNGDFIEAITTEIKKIPHLNRAYIMYRDDALKTYGKFIIGQRKNNNPWD